MIVIHPEDPTTKVLSLIYENIPSPIVFNSWQQKAELLKTIKSTPKAEPILMLGHGTPLGLLDRRYGFIIEDEDADILIERPNLVGVWCFASDFAREHNLKGFFSGMFISEEIEAQEYNINAEKREIEENAREFSLRFGEMLSAGIKLNNIAKELMDLRHRNSELTEFNYSRLTWRS